MTPLPTVIFNASTGSDTAASGYGPATAVSGTAGGGGLLGLILIIVLVLMLMGRF